MTTNSLPDPHSDPHLDHWHDQEWAGRDKDITQEFWGEGAGWSPQTADAGSPRAGLGATVGRWRSTGAKSRRGATRTHGVRTAADLVDDDFPSADAEADEAGLADWDDSWDAAPSEPPRSGIDPLLARLGGLAVVLTLLVPVVMGFTSDDGDAVRTASAPIEAAAPLAGTESPATTGSETVPASPATPSVVDVTVDVDPATPETARPSTALPTAARPTTESDVEALVVDQCAVDYEVAAGDFWIRIADGSGTSLNELLALNDATASTPLYPGRSICLPAGSTTPPPPTPTTVAPRTVSRTNSARSGATTSTSTSTSKTSTTTAPAPPPPPASTASPGDVEAIIRSVWPDELEGHALEIAWRESKYRATAKNNCCYGVFQIYWSVHRSWLAELGITSAEKLYDPTLNARAALRLYERAGGWGPWGG